MQTFELKFSGVTILQGVEFHVFLLILSRALQQCSATALPVIKQDVSVNHITFFVFCFRFLVLVTVFIISQSVIVIINKLLFFSTWHFSLLLSLTKTLMHSDPKKSCEYDSSWTNESILIKYIAYDVVTGTCEIKLFQNYFTFRRRRTEIILFQCVETCLNYFKVNFRSLLKLMNIFQQVQCRLNNFEIISTAEIILFQFQTCLHVK